MDEKSISIPEIPVIEPRIIDAFFKKELAIFLGAGVSRLKGCMGWKDLANNFIDECYNEGLINFNEKIKLQNLPDQKKKITIAYHLLEIAEKRETFFEIMRKSFNEDGHNSDTVDIYDTLKNLGLFLTSNADTHFDKYFGPDIIFKDFDEDTINENYLYHIHGSITHPDSLVFKVEDYIKHYNNEQFQKFMEKIFSTKVVLFIGYGLTEYELLDYLITRLNNQNVVKKDIFILKPYFNDEYRILFYEKNYYEGLGIEIIPYSIDNKGYKQLYDVLIDWREKIERKTPLISDFNNQIDDAIKSFDQQKIERVLRLLKYNKFTKNYFYSNLRNTQKLEKAIDFIRNNEFFDINLNFDNLKAYNNDGEYFGLYNFIFYISQRTDFETNRNSINFVKYVIENIVKISEKEPLITSRAVTELVSMLPARHLFKIQISHLKHILKRRKNNMLNSGCIYPITKTIIKLKEEETKQDLIFDLIEIIFSFDFYVYNVDELQGGFSFFVLENEYKNSLENLLIENRFFKKTVKILVKNIDSYYYSNYNYRDKITYYKQKFADTLNKIIARMIKKQENSLENDTMELMISSIFYKTQEIALKIIRSDFSKYKDLFLNHMSELIKVHYIYSELWEVLNENGEAFVGEEISELINHIESIGTEEFEINLIKDFLSSFRNLEDELVKQKIQEYNISIIENDTFSNPFEDYLRTKIIDISAKERKLQVKKEIELLNLSNTEIAQFFSDPIQIQNSDYPFTMSFSILNFVSKYPEKISENFDAFKDSSFDIQVEILMGIHFALENNRIFDYNAFIDYIIDTITKSEFQSNLNDDEKNSYNNFLRKALMNLRKLQSKDIVIEISDQKITDFYLNLLEMTEKFSGISFDEYSNSDNIFFHPLYEIYKTVFHIIYKTDNEDIKSKISRKIHEIINKKKDSKGNFELWLYTSYYYSTLLKLEESVYSLMFNDIFKTDDEERWQISFANFVSSLDFSGFNRDIFKKLKEDGHFTKCFENFDLYYGKGLKISIFRLTSFIIWAYLVEEISIDDKLLLQIIENGRDLMIRSIFGYFNHLKESEYDYDKDKVKQIFIRIFNHISTGVEDQDSDLKWIFLDNINIVADFEEDFENWLNFSSEFIPQNVFEFRVLPKMMENLENHPKIFADVFIKIINSGKIPKFHNEKIILLIQSLVKHDLVEKALEICNIYHRNGCLDYDEIKKGIEEIVKSQRN